MEYTNSTHVKKALVSLAIETVLIGIGKPTYDEVIHKLFTVYNSYISDCYEHPEYLKAILKELYGASSISIIESLKKQLEEFELQEGIDVFVKTISG